MDKNTLLGLLMMGAVIFGFMWLNKPSEEEIAARRAEQEQIAEQQRIEAEKAAAEAIVLDTISSAEKESLAAVIRSAGTLDSLSGVYSFATASASFSLDPASPADAISGTVDAGGNVIPVADVLSGRFPESLSMSAKKAAVQAVRDAVNVGSRYRSFARYLAGNDETVVLQNDLVALELSSHGGVISRATLKNYDTYINNDTALVSVIQPLKSAYSFTLTSASQRFNTSDFYFTPVIENDSTVLMKMDLAGGATWGMRYTLRPGSYITTLEVVQSGMTDIIPASVASADFNWDYTMARNESGRTFEERNSALTYKFLGDSPDEMSANKRDHESLNQRVKWIAFKNQFFSVVAIPRNSFTSAELNSEPLHDSPDDVKNMSVAATLDYSSSSPVPVTIDIFTGPNLYPLLASLDDTVDTPEDLQLTRLIPLGWPIIRWISTLIIIPVFTWLGGFISNYGIIILLLTVFIKILLFGFTYKSFMSQAKMRVLAPEIKEINDKYPGQENAMVRNQKTMALYSKAGASPFSGCLPMLLQMPILVAMFWFFPSCIELRGQSFLWAHNLAAPDVIATLPFSIPFYGNHVSLFCLLMTAVNIIYTRINMQNQPSQASMPAMKWMMYLMPVMFLFFFNDYAAGLSYYYFLSLLITIVQTYIFRRCVDEKKVRQRMLENAAKPRKKSGFMARMEEMQREQQRRLREQQKKGGRR